MPIEINSNAGAAPVAYNLSRPNDFLKPSLERLSSGRRINFPADDAAGLAVSHKFKSEGNISIAKNVSEQNRVMDAFKLMDVGKSGMVELWMPTLPARRPVSSGTVRLCQRITQYRVNPDPVIY
jgi:hypothetical protein